MSTQRESVCCHEVEQTYSLLEDPASCITQHADFRNVCLCRAVLSIALYSHLHYHEGVEVPDDENR